MDDMSDHSLNGTGDDRDHHQAPERAAYDLFQRGLRLLQDGHAHAAVPSLERARGLEPAKGSVREALARAYYNSHRFESAREEFAETVEINPTNDYAHFGLGLCCLRLGDRTAAQRHLKLAVVMNPGVPHYERALQRAGASLDAFD